MYIFFKFKLSKDRRDRRSTQQLNVNSKIFPIVGYAPRQALNRGSGLWIFFLPEGFQVTVRQHCLAEGGEVLEAYISQDIVGKKI